MAKLNLRESDFGYKSGGRYYGGLPAEPEYDGPGKRARYWKELHQYFKEKVREYPEYYVIGTSPTVIILRTPDGKETIDLTKFDALADADEAIEMASHYFDESLFESKKKKKTSGITLNTDAGNVEQNIEMFNHMNNPVDSPSTNPCGPMAENISESTTSSKETIDLDYTKLEIEVCTRRGNSSGYYSSSFGNYLPDEDDVTTVKVDHTLTVDKEEVEDFLCGICEAEEISSADLKAHDDDWDEFIHNFVSSNFDDLFVKYNDDILDYWEEDAKKEAQEEHYDTYFESVDKLDDLEHGEEVFMESYDLQESNNTSELNISDYFNMMNNEEIKNNMKISQLNEDYLDSAEFRIQRYEDEIPELFHKIHDGYMSGMVNAKAYAEALHKIYDALEELDNDEFTVGKLVTHVDDSTKTRGIIVKRDGNVATVRVGDKDDYVDVDVSKLQLDEGFDQSVDLDRVAMKVANLLDFNALGENNWIEFDYDDARTLTSGNKNLTFKAIGETKTLRGHMTTRGNKIEIQLRNGSEAMCTTVEGIARFIAGEFDIAL